MPNNGSISKFLLCSRFAVVGASADRAKFGNKVLRCYLQHGKDTTPVNARTTAIEGRPCAPSLENINDVMRYGVSIVTPASVTAPVLQQALQCGVTNIWLQPGTTDEACDAIIATAREKGINIISGDGACLLQTLGFADDSDGTVH